jgi:hypothetical protein
VIPLKQGAVLRPLLLLAKTCFGGLHSLDLTLSCKMYFARFDCLFLQGKKSTIEVLEEIEKVKSFTLLVYDYNFFFLQS